MRGAVMVEALCWLLQGCVRQHPPHAALAARLHPVCFGHWGETRMCDCAS